MSGEGDFKGELLIGVVALNFLHLTHIMYSSAL
jgi:hypothetical protein